MDTQNQRMTFQSSPLPGDGSDDDGFIKIEDLVNASNGLLDDRDYRRGYHHGYDKALIDVVALLKGPITERNREALNILDEFFDGALTDWRNRGGEEGFNPPPLLGQWLREQKKTG